MLSEALRLIRIFHDMKQAELAERLGVAKSYISEIEANKKVPTIALLEKYSEVFGIPLSSIMFFSENLQGKNNLDQSSTEKARSFISSKVLSILSFIAERSGRNHAEEKL